MSLNQFSGVVLACLAFGASGCAASGGHDHGTAMAKAKSPYTIKGDQVEGCECASVCPCAFAHDTTFGDCRATMVWHIREGMYGNTPLGGVSFAVVLTKAGKNVVKEMGKWEGVIYVSANANPGQKAAVVDFLSSNWGKAFAKIDVQSEPIEFQNEGEKYEVKIGKIAVLRTTPIAGAEGKAPMIENTPFHLIPVMHCATTTENTYDDGKGTKWDFKERNSFFGPFDYRGE